VMSDSASDIGEGLVVGFENLYESVKDSGAYLFIFASAGMKRKSDKSADGDNDDQYGNRFTASKCPH
jgi:hypothetical protein